MKSTALITLLLALVFNASARKFQHSHEHDSAAASSDFILIVDKNDIKIYERWFAFDSTIKAREIKIVFDIHTRVQSAVDLLRDESQSLRWNPGSSQFRVVQDGDQWTSYVRYDLPWPLSDQDCVLRYNFNARSDSNALINFESASHSYFPVSKDISRISDIRGKWRFTQERQSIHVEYYVTTTPSKSLPRWVTDPIIRNNLLDMMVKFRQLLEALNN